MTTIAYAYNRFCTRRNRLPTEQQVAELEWRIKVHFPDDYRRYILEFNGGYFTEPILTPPDFEAPSASLTYMRGINSSHPSSELGRETDMTLFDDNDPPKIMPIGGTPMGDLVILGLEPEVRGEIFFKKAWGDFYFLAEDIDEFFEQLREPAEDE